MREFNMSISTQIGMIQIDNPIFKPIDYLRLGAGGHYSEDIASYCFIQFANRWLGLPDIEKVVDDIDEYFMKYRTPLYKNQQGNLPMDKTHKQVMVFVNKTRPLALKPQIPDWVRKEMNVIRERIRIS